MASWLDKHEKIGTAKILVVGAGGIGCELLKNLAATGFRKVHVIDLDTIDISNLNRQFLFRKDHVSKSKAEIATSIIKQFCPAIDLTFDHDSIFEEKYNVDFFKSFDMIMNALDNRQARNHVNRMCHAANRPLIESGSAGYFGQVQIIIRDLSECYECEEKPKQKTFPGCTIRNTPSEHIHCTVWSKHVFNLLFGEIDIDDDVSPDLKAIDPENPEGEESEQEKEAIEKEPAPVGTRQWAESVDFDPVEIFDKLFHKDIMYLGLMEHLWHTRKRPTPLSFNKACHAGRALTNEEAQKEDTSIWSIATCALVFSSCVRELTEQIKKEPNVKLSFDKDHPTIMAFVTACANIRAHIFGIQTKSMFEIKAMAGNIIPAIASTNAIVAGMMVTQGLKVLENHENLFNCILLPRGAARGRVFTTERLRAPNPKCYVCSKTPEVFIYVNTESMTVNALCEKVLKQELNMLAPDVIDSNYRIIISSDGETDDLLNKKLSEVSIEDGAILSCDDYKQDLALKLYIRKSRDLQGDHYEISRSGQDQLEEEKRKRKVEEDDENEEPDVKRSKPDANDSEISLAE